VGYSIIVPNEKLRNYQNQLDAELTKYLDEKFQKEQEIQNRWKAKEEEERLRLDQAEQKRLEKETKRLKKEKDKQQAIETENQRRSDLGWTGRYGEDVEKGIISPKNVLEFMKLDITLPENEYSDASNDQLKQEKNQLGKRLFDTWHSQWGTHPKEHWQKEARDQLRQILGLSIEKPVVDKIWSEDKSEFEKQVADEKWFNQLNKQQLIELAKDAEKILENKRAKKLKKKINARKKKL